MRIRTGLVAMILGLPASAMAQRAPFPIPDPDPEVERKSFQVAPGFEVNLFAADPLLAKPIQMNFDARGRLWVASSEVYPQIRPGQAANDKVLILEDKDGDGRADSTSVFADGLLIPTGVEPGDGGAYVANSTEIVHLKDTDGDGKADSRRVVLSGFGTEDTHHIVHTFRWGEDGMLYFNQSIYIHSHVETPYGPRRLNAGGIWQFRPETMDLNVFARGWVNSWGHHRDAWGASFATDGAGGEGINFIVPGAYYIYAADAARILPGLNPGSPKYSGLEVVSGRHLPDDWQGNLLTNDFRANRVCRFVLGDDGSGFASREQPELIKTTHGAFRPIDVKMGPDGAIYIADWYNPIIQHGEVDFRDPRRDHTRGRIWRVTATGRPLVEKPKLDGATIPDLLASLRSPEGYTRHFAKLVLKDRGAKAVLPSLADWVKALDPKSPTFEHDRLEALWLYQTLDSADPDLLASVLNSPDPRARAAASRVVPHWQGRISDALALLAPRAEDEHPRVRLEAVRALAKIDDPRSLQAAMKALDRPVDKWLDYALWLCARETQSRWLPMLQAGTLDLGGDARKLTFALNAAGSASVVGPLLDALRSGRIGESQGASAVRMIAEMGDAKQLAGLFDLALAGGTSAPGKAAILDALASAARSRKARPEGDANRLTALLDSDDREVRRAAINALGAWKAEALVSAMLGSITRKPDASLNAFYYESLSEIGGTHSRDLLARAAKGSPPAVAAKAVVALAALDPGAAAPRAIELLRGFAKTSAQDDRDSATAMLSGFLRRKGGSEALRDAVAGLAEGDLPADAAKLATRAARASGRDETALIDALSKAAKIAPGPVALGADQMIAMVGEVASSGDPARGEAVFRRKEMQCLNCHAVAGAGGQVGPGLESIGASAPVDYLIDSLLQPSKAVKEGYHAVTVATDDGRVLTGVKLRDDASGLLLRDAEGREVAIPSASVEQKKDAGSLMPAGLTETLTRGEFLDLVRFLSELGKVGPYSVSKARLVRRWQVHPSDRAESVADWSPLYSRVDGTLPLDSLPPSEAPFPARFELDVTTPGAVRFRLDSTSGIAEIRVDGSSIPVRPEILADLASGRHAVTLLFDPKSRPQAVRCAIEDAPGSPARAQPVLGR